MRQSKCASGIALCRTKNPACVWQGDKAASLPESRHGRDQRSEGVKEGHDEDSLFGKVGRGRPEEVQTLGLGRDAHVGNQVVAPEEIRRSRGVVSEM